MNHRKRNYIDPWGKRRHPYRYTPKALREMIVDDLVRYKPPGGPMEEGVAFLLGAVEKIAEADRSNPEATWLGLQDEASARLGHKVIPALA